jgi:Class II Aldolase and Adducin N-terminal domain
VDLDERERIVGDLGPHDALIMRNHGLLTCGATIQQAFNTMYQLEMSCRSQVDAMAACTELTMPGENVLAHTAHLYQPGTRRPYGVLEWPAMLRLLEAEGRQSSYPPGNDADPCPGERSEDPGHEGQDFSTDNRRS